MYPKEFLKLMFQAELTLAIHHWDAGDKTNESFIYTSFL